MLVEAPYRFIQSVSQRVRSCMLVCILASCVVTQHAYADGETVVFVANASMCQTACNVAIQNFHRLIQSNVPHGDTLRTYVYVADVRKAAARYYSEQLGVELMDSLHPTYAELIKGMQTPIAVITGSDNRLLIIDALTQKEPKTLDSMARAFMSRSTDEKQSSYLKTTPLASLHEVEVATVQAISDSVGLVYDRVRGEALLVSMPDDRILTHARLPPDVRYQFRDSANAQQWSEYERMGVKMTQAYCAYVTDTPDQAIVFGLSQYAIKGTSAADGTAAAETRLSGRNARWQCPIKAAQKHTAQSDTATGTNIAVFGTAPQRFHGVTMLVGGTNDAYSNNPDSQFIASYANASGEHLFLSRSHVSHRDSTFSFYSLTKLSGMYEGRVMVANCVNGVFGIFDTVQHVFRHIEQVGPIRAMCTTKGAATKVGGYIGPYLLVDTVRRQYHVVSLSVVEANVKSGPLGVTVNTYDFDSGKHVCLRTFNTITELGMRSLIPYHVRDSILYAVSQSDDATVLVAIKM